MGRNAQGVKLMTLNDDDKVVSLAAVQQDNTDCGESDGSDDAAIETDAETVVSEEVTAEEVVTTEE